MRGLNTCYFLNFDGRRCAWDHARSINVRLSVAQLSVVGLLQPADNGKQGRRREVGLRDLFSTEQLLIIAISD
jgi:hypothetical protein